MGPAAHDDCRTYLMYSAVYPGFLPASSALQIGEVLGDLAQSSREETTSWRDRKIDPGDMHYTDRVTSLSLEQIQSPRIRPP